MQVSVLGGTEVWRDGLRVDLGTRKRRALVAALALAGGRPVSVDALVDLLWNDTPPDGVVGTLQAYVSGLRRALEPDRAPRAPATVLVTVGAGYALHLPVDALDAARFEGTVTDIHRSLGRRRTPWQQPDLAGDPLREAVADLDTALGLWRGTPYADLGDHPTVLPERGRLEELRAVALEDRAHGELALGRHATVAAELEALTAAHPLRERLWALRSLALARSGRQADALAVLREVREILADELGLEPSAELRELQAALLRQDPDLLAPPADPGVATAGPQPSRPVDRFVPVLPPWRMVGRAAQLAALTDALDRADAGAPGFAVLTGEPGIGKSRLCAEIGGVAVRRGARLLVGRCSQDEGAPPLRPWRQVLEGLGIDLEETETQQEDLGAEFRTWEALVSRLVAAARDETLVVVLDDLHWADEPTLRALRLLAEQAHTGRLLVIGTWRSHPEPAGALADVAEVLARRHAVRLDLGGLDASQAAEVVEAVAEVTPDGAQAELLANRTDGNPFFLVEYARLARDGGDLAGLMSEEDPPTAVADVLERRLARLPEETRDLLRWAAVLGRFFEPSVIAEAVGLEEDRVLDGLDPAVDAGLVREDGVDRYRFAHALVRDQIYGALRATRRARAHARVAAVVEELPDRESEAARHWLDAGPDHVGRAWRAARAAAGAARRVHAHGTSAELLGAALACQGRDRASTAQDRFTLLLELAEAHRWRGSWGDLHETVEQAIDVADELGDPRLLARAASALTFGAIWQSATHGETHGSVVSALRRVLAALPGEDDELRCRVMLGLASELYYSSGADERAALIDSALAMARRLGDDLLLLDACQVGYVAQWRCSTAEQRLALAREAMQLAERGGHEREWVVAATLAAVVLAELGDVAQMWEVSTSARRQAERLRLPYSIAVLDTLQLPWYAMAGRFEEAEERFASLSHIAGGIRMDQMEQGVAGGLVTLRLWQGRIREVQPVLAALAEGPLPVTAISVAVLLRGGLDEEARALAATHPVTLEGDDWFSMINWAAAAEVALALDDRELAASSYDLMAPYAGRSVAAGSGSAMGPVDGFLALAAAAVGDRDLAARHADAALALMETWQVPLAAQWLRDQRDRHGF